MLISLGLVAFFYALVGHGGASGYIAMASLWAQPMAAMKAQALMLNLGVAGIAALLFARARLMRWDLLLFLALGSVPAAYFAAGVQVGAAWASGLLAIALGFSAVRLLFFRQWQENFDAIHHRQAQPVTLVLVGIVLGIFAGLTGVGGGIYLSPLLLLLGWADLKETAACSAAFIFINSLAGLAGMAAVGPLPSLPTSWLFVTLTAGSIGALLGSTWVPQRRMAQFLAGILFLAAIKLGAHVIN